MTASEYRVKVRAQIDAQREEYYEAARHYLATPEQRASNLRAAAVVGRTLAELDRLPLPADIAEPPPPPTATAEPGVPRRGKVWEPAGWVTTGPGYVPLPSAGGVTFSPDGRGGVIEERYRYVPAEIGNSFHSPADPWAKYDRFPVTVQECPRGGPAGPEITVPPGWRLHESRWHRDIPGVWCCWFLPVAEGLPRFPTPYADPPGWQVLTGPERSTDHPGGYYVSFHRPKGKPEGGNCCHPTDPAAVRRAALLEAAGVCDGLAGELREWARDYPAENGPKVRTAEEMARRLRKLAE